MAYSPRETAVQRYMTAAIFDDLETGEEDDDGDLVDAAMLTTEAVASVLEEAHAQAQKKVKCDTCGALYGNLESLKRHIRKKHPRSGEAIIASGISESGNETLEINAQ